MKKAIKKFETAQRKYKNFGASDTEPDGVWQRLLLNTVEGKAPVPPRTGASWELYANSMDCSEAATALFDAAMETIHAIESCPIRDLDQLKTYLKDYCWRFA